MAQKWNERPVDQQFLKQDKVARKMLPVPVVLIIAGLLSMFFGVSYGVILVAAGALLGIIYLVAILPGMTGG